MGNVGHYMIIKGEDDAKTLRHNQADTVYHLMDIEPIVQEHSMQDALMQLFDKWTKTFTLGNIHQQFRAVDVSLVLGLRYDGSVIEFK